MFRRECLNKSSDFVLAKANVFFSLSSHDLKVVANNSFGNVFNIIVSTNSSHDLQVVE